MFRNMATSLIEEERIETTTAKAKELRSIVEKLITLGSRNAVSVIQQGGDETEVAKRTANRVAAVRQAGRYIRNRDVLQKLFGEIAERFVGRPGGYTRVMRTRRRLGDNAEMAIIELLPAGYEANAEPSAPEYAATPAPAAPVIEEAAAEAPAEEAAAEAPAEESAAEAPAEEAAAEEAAAEAPAEEPAAEEPAAEEAAAEAPAEEPAAEEPAAEEAAAEEAAEAVAEEAAAEEKKEEE